MLKTLDYVVIVSPVGGRPAQIFRVSCVPKSTGKGSGPGLTRY
jgi:hypothetical protein